MTEWNDKKNMNLTFKVKPAEDATAFFDRMMKDFTEREKAFKIRIKQLFDENIGVEGTMADEAYEQILQVFAIGYQHGWNDFHSLYKDESK